MSEKVSSTWNNSIVVVLVETSESLNIGSVSRVMGNFNFTDLRIVNAADFSRERAGVTACGATKALDGLTHFATLQEALNDCVNAVGFSARCGKTRGRVIELPRWIDSLKDSPPVKTALVFGPEDNGLRQEHVELCSSLVFIPTAESYPSMNLAHAVALALYSVVTILPSGGEEYERASLRDYEQLDMLVADVARASGFFHKGTPQPLPSTVKTIFRRLHLTAREMAVLLGIFATTKKALRGTSAENEMNRPDSLE